MVPRDGRVIEAAAEFIRGEAEPPDSEAALESKFLALTTPSRPDTAPAAFRAIERIPDLAAARIGG